MKKSQARPSNALQVRLRIFDWTLHTQQGSQCGGLTTGLMWDLPLNLASRLPAALERAPAGDQQQTLSKEWGAPRPPAWGEIKTSVGERAQFVTRRGWSRAGRHLGEGKATFAGLRAGIERWRSMESDPAVIRVKAGGGCQTERNRHNRRPRSNNWTLQYRRDLCNYSSDLVMNTGSYLF